MAARRGRGGRGRGNMEFAGDERDAEIHALRRQVEELTIRLERQEARSERGSGHGYSSDDSKYENPFANKETNNFFTKFNRSANFVKMNIPEFHGRFRPDEFLDWLSAVEKFFEYQDTSEDQKVKLVATRLQGYASLWWDKMQDMRLRKGKLKITYWEKMKARLHENFLPADFARNIFIQFNTLQQGNKAVTDYTEEFYKLMSRSSSQESEDQLVARYIEGLKPTIKDEVEMQQLWRLNDAYQLALKVESKLQRLGAKRYADIQSLYSPNGEPNSKNIPNVGAIHDGRKNTYTFMTEKVKIVLLPCKDISYPKSPKKEEGSVLLILPQLRREIQAFKIGAYNKFKEKNIGQCWMLKKIKGKDPNSETSSFQQVENDVIQIRRICQLDHPSIFRS